MNSRSLSWQKLEERYSQAQQYMPEACEIHHAMAHLCAWISRDDNASSLFGVCSLYTLMIAQTKLDYPIHASAQYLQIDPQFDTGKVEFRFVDTQIDHKQWVRIEPPNAVALRKRLIGFIKQVGWSND